MSRLISSLMQPRVWSIDMDDTISEVERQFSEHRLTWAPVLEAKSTVVGVISAVDLLQFHAQERDPMKVAAWQLCSYKPICVDENAPLSEVARQMTARGIHHVVVTRGDDIVGVVSSMDFVRTFVEAG